MAPKTKEQFAKIRRDRREEILHTAVKLFAGRGIDHTTIQDIALQVGISKGLIYNYFDSKEALLEELIKNGIDQMYRYFDPNCDGILTAHELEYFIEEQVTQLKQNAGFWKCLLMVLIQPPAQDLLYRLGFVEINARIRNIMADYFRIRSWKDPEMEAWYLHTLMDGICMNYIFDPENFPIDKMKKLLIGKYVKTEELK